MPPGSAAEAGQPAGGERQLFRGTASEVIGDVKTYQALGVTHFVFDPIGADVKGWLASWSASPMRYVRGSSGPRASRGRP